MDVNFDCFHIVGFEGVPKEECGRTLPLYLEKKSGAYYQIDNYSAGLPPRIRKYDKSTIHELSENQQLTFLPRSFDAIPNAMIFYLKKELLNEFDNQYDLVRDFNEFLVLEFNNDSFYICLGTSKDIEHVMDKLGEMFIEKINVKLQYAFISYNAIKASSLKESRFLAARKMFYSRMKEVERLCDIALRAARKNSLRAIIYIRYGAAIKNSAKPERLRNLFKLFIARSNPDWQWEDYLSQIDFVIDAQLDQTKHINSFLYTNQNIALKKLHDLEFSFEETINEIALMPLPDEDEDSKSYKAIVKEVINALNQHGHIEFSELSPRYKRIIQREPLVKNFLGGAGNQTILKVINFFNEIRELHRDKLSNTGRIIKEILLLES